MNGWAVFAACVSVSCVSAAVPPWADGFESYPNTALSSSPDWYAPAGYFRVLTTGFPRSGTHHASLDVGSYGDWGHVLGLGFGWTNYQLNYADGWVSYSPATGAGSVLTMSAYAKIVPQGPYSRPVVCGIELVNPTGGTISSMFLQGDGSLAGLTVYDYDNSENFGETWGTLGGFTDMTQWNRLLIRVDFSNRSVRFEHNGVLLFVSAITATELGRISMVTIAYPKAPINSGRQPILYFDDVSVTTAAHCDGDFNLDFLVDDGDFSMFVQSYDMLDCATIFPHACSSDLDGNGVVDDADFVLFVSAYDALLCP